MICTCKRLVEMSNISQIAATLEIVDKAGFLVDRACIIPKRDPYSFFAFCALKSLTEVRVFACGSCSGIAALLG